MEPERVPGSSLLAVLWMAGCRQGDMGDVEGDMAVPRRDDGQTGASGKNDQVPEPMPRRGRGGTPLKAGVGVLQTSDCPVFYTP